MLGLFDDIDDLVITTALLPAYMAGDTVYYPGAGGPRLGVVCETPTAGAVSVEVADCMLDGRILGLGFQRWARELTPTAATVRRLEGKYDA